MKKRMLLGGFLLVLVLLFTGCNEAAKNDKPAPLTPLPTGGQKTVTPTIEPTITYEPFRPITETANYRMTTDNIKTIGRTYLLNDVRWLGFSGSGVEFFFAGRELSVNLIGDDIRSKDRCARVAVYVDGERVQDVLMDEPAKSIDIIKDETDTIAVVRIIKLSEVSDSTVGIDSVSVMGVISPLQDKKRKLEFIGDSITCGYGVDGEFEKDVYETGNEDCTKAYAYRTAELLEAEYSLVSLSGYGIVSGYTGSGERNTMQTLPQYYGTLGKSYGHFAGTTAPETVSWDFKEYVPDTVVINLGTNDASYCGADPERRREYIDGYKDFLKAVRARNEKARIVCTLGIMGTDLCESMETAVKEYTEETGDTNIVTMRFPMQDQAADGVVVDWHPSAATHEKAAKQLAAFLEELYQKDAEAEKQQEDAE